jgi:hypothetical protein
MFSMLGNLFWCVSVVCLLGGMYGRLYGWTPHNAIAPTAVIVAGVVALVLGGTFHGMAGKGDEGKAGNA